MARLKAAYLDCKYWSRLCGRGGTTQMSRLLKDK
jgi:hypothetical protein